MADVSTDSRAATDSEEMLALRRRRMAAARPFFRGGFRPFFFAAGLWAIIAISLWLGSLRGEIGLPTAFDPLAWHRHEMLFGFVGAVICGFLPTGAPNWTGRLPMTAACQPVHPVARREAIAALLGSNRVVARRRSRVPTQPRRYRGHRSGAAAVGSAARVGRRSGWTSWASSRAAQRSMR
jgi:hypothetical protein